MTEEERVHYLLKYHDNLTKQYIDGLATSRQLGKVEKAIEDLLFDDDGSDENES